ncbi:MAG: hypothetical protein ACKVOU_11685 [Cytophagales bacterium]
MGIYITSIHDIKLQENYFGVDFWVWYVYRKEYAKQFGLNPLKTVNLLNIYNGEVAESYVKIDSSLKNDFYVLKKVSAKIRNDFDVRDFPFDNQVLHLKFEDAENEKRRLKFILSETPFSKSGIDNNLHINGIKIKSNFHIAHEQHKYNNNFGNPKALKNKEAFDRVVATVDVQREVGFLFLKLFTGLYVSFFIAIISLFVHPRDLSTRFSLPVGSLFAAVGNKYFVDALLPNVNSLTLADILHAVTFIFIFLIILYSAINIYVVKPAAYKSGIKELVAADMKAFKIIASTYVLINAFFIIKAML